MATVRVSSSSALQSALRSAGSGTKIELTSGTYNLKLSSGDYHGAVITSASGANVTFSGVELRGAKHLTFDDVNFKLPSAHKGVVIANSTGITIQDSNLNGPTVQNTVGVYVNNSDDFSLLNNHITGFATAVKLSSISGLTVSNNDISNVAWDAMIVGGVHNALFAGNDISLNTPNGRKHTDGMQFYNNGGIRSSDVTIRNNTIETHNSTSHGIYFANDVADTGGGTTSFAKNLLIEDNTIVSGQVSGIAVGQTTELTIRDNVILQDPQHHSTKDISIPVIRVEHELDRSQHHRQHHPQGAGREWPRLVPHRQVRAGLDDVEQQDRAARDHRRPCDHRRRRERFGGEQRGGKQRLGQHPVRDHQRRERGCRDQRRGIVGRAGRRRLPLRRQGPCRQGFGHRLRRR